MLKRFTIFGLTALAMAAAFSSCQKQEMESFSDEAVSSDGTRASSFSPRFDIDWDSVPASRPGSSLSAISSFRATADKDYLYMLVKVDASQLSSGSTHHYDNFMTVYLYDSGSSSTNWKEKGKRIDNLCGWLITDQRPKFTYWGSDVKYQCVKVNGTIYNEIRFPRSLDPLLQKSSIKLGVTLSDRYYRYDESYSSRNNLIGCIPSKGKNMYALSTSGSNSNDTPAPTPTLPVMGKGYHVATFSGISDLSGLCLSKDKKSLWGVCNNDGSLYQISFEGKILKHVASFDDDTEDVCIDPSGNLYIAVEGDTYQSMLKAKSPYSSASKVMAISKTQTSYMGNGGIEGITWYNKGNGGKGTIYLGSQDAPFSGAGDAYLWEYNPSNGELKQKGSLKSLTKHTVNGSTVYDLNEVGGMDYDAERDWLWVIDSDLHHICVFDGAATKLLATYDFHKKITYKSGSSSYYIGNTESICVDRANSCVWVADDASSSRLYKIPFTNL